MRLTRAHLEEDAGKSLHEAFRGISGIDLNRAGTPLLEIVSEPDLRSAQEAVAYARALHALVVWIGICDGNMQEGSFRCDANVSVRPAAEQLGTRREIKNLNSFRFMEQAIEFEAAPADRDARRRRQDRAGDAAVRSRQQRNPLDAHARKTRTTTATFPIPICCRWSFASRWIDEIRTALPELPEHKRGRVCNESCRSALTTRRLLTSSREMADYYERAVSAADLRSRGSPTIGQLDHRRLCRDRSTTPNLEIPRQYGDRRAASCALAERDPRRHHFSKDARARCSTPCGPARATPTRSSRSAA